MRKYLPRRRARVSRGALKKDESSAVAESPNATLVVPVRQAYVADEEDKSLAARELQPGYEVAPGQFAVVRSEELWQRRQPTSAAMEILRSVRMNEIDSVFLETSYYVVPGNGGEHSYGLFYRALKESGYAALAEVAMHGRQDVVVIRPGATGLIAHTMYYVNEGAETKSTRPMQTISRPRSSTLPCGLWRRLQGLSGRRNSRTVTARSWNP
jgi:DNA end-binding protein Ku